MNGGLSACRTKGFDALVPFVCMCVFVHVFFSVIWVLVRQLPL